MLNQIPHDWLLVMRHRFQRSWPLWLRRGCSSSEHMLSANGTERFSSSYWCLVESSVSPRLFPLSLYPELQNLDHQVIVSLTFRRYVKPLISWSQLNLSINRVQRAGSNTWYDKRSHLFPNAHVDRSYSSVKSYLTSSSLPLPSTDYSVASTGSSWHVQNSPGYSGKVKLCTLSP